MSTIPFILWWYAVLCVLGVAAWLPQANRAPIEWEQVTQTFLIGIAIGLVLYMVPRGLHSVGSLRDFELRVLAALGISWLWAHRAVQGTGDHNRESALAFAAFVGVNLPPLALVASLFMLGGSPGSL